jgi:cell division protein FtsL
MLITMQRTIKYISLAVLLLLLGAQQVFAQGDATELESKVEGHTERILTLESSVAKISQMKISGYVQPQLFWQDIIA